MIDWSNIVKELIEKADILSIIAAVLISIIPVLIAVLKNLRLREMELRHERFKIYHELIRQLVEPNATGHAFIDRQIAITFELRSFGEYQELTDRILRGLEEAWSKNPNNERLVKEIQLTLKHINSTNA